MRQFDRNKSLQELEGKDWGEPDFNSNLVIECHRLRRVPLRDLTPGNVCRMIGQHIGLPYLIPIALELLQADPFTEGDFYRGDLLKAVLLADSRFWIANSELQRHHELRNRRFPRCHPWTKSTETPYKTNSHKHTKYSKEQNTLRNTEGPDQE